MNTWLVPNRISPRSVAVVKSAFADAGIDMEPVAGGTLNSLADWVGSSVGLGLSPVIDFTTGTIATIATVTVEGIEVYSNVV